MDFPPSYLKTLLKQPRIYVKFVGVPNRSLMSYALSTFLVVPCAVPNPLITPFSGTNFRVGLTQIWVDVDYGQIKSLYQIAVCAETKQSSGIRA